MHVDERSRRRWALLVEETGAVLIEAASPCIPCVPSTSVARIRIRCVLMTAARGLDKVCRTA